MTRTPLGGLAVAASILALLAFAAGASARAGQNPGADAPNPLAGQTWWDQNTQWNPTWNGYRSLLPPRAARGRGQGVAAGRDAAVQVVRGVGATVVGKLQGMFEQAGDSVPLLAVFGDEHQGCGSPGTNTSGGLGQNASYKSWIDQVARGIGSNEVVIAFEPDSLGLIECLRPSLRAPRLRALAYGVKALSKLPNATVYVEAGAPDWQDVPTMARKFRAVGVSRVRGFMLNATHHVTTAKNLRYGAKLSRAVGGKHFIVNTSHNGNGALYRNGHTIWCNPPNAAAGPLPTTNTGHPKADAFMWVERPGFSNGSCNGGPARVGAWWEQRAIQMVERAQWWRGSR